MTAPRFTANPLTTERPNAQIALTLMQAAAELELLPAKHYARWGRNYVCAIEISDLMRQIEQLVAEWRVIANES